MFGMDVAVLLTFGGFLTGLACACLTCAAVKCIVRYLEMRLEERKFE